MENKLQVTITSFSYKNGIPEDDSVNGGGFVFDCRAIHNPGRYEKYKELTGKDKEVIDFLKKEKAMNEFLKYVFAIVDISIQNYTKRNFAKLMVSFGCTGGQHRSVYAAECLTEYLKKYDIITHLNHREQKSD